MKNPLIVCLATGAVILSACGGSESSGSNLTMGSNGLAFSSGEAATLSTLQGETLDVTSVAAKHRSNGNGFGIGASSFDMTVDNENRIRISDGKGGELALNRTGGTGPFTGTLDGSNLSGNFSEAGSLFFGQISRVRSGADSEDGETFFVTGFESNPANLTGQATYDGTAEMFARNVVSGSAAAAATKVLDGEMILTVDFAASTASANISGDDDEGRSLVFAMPNTTISDNSFTGFAEVATGSASDLNFSSITLDGKFYGENGDQVGGILRGVLDGGPNNNASGMPSGEGTVAGGIFQGGRAPE